MTLRVEELQQLGVPERNWRWRERRLRLGLTVRQVAVALEHSPAYVARIESGSELVRPQMYRRLERFYQEAEQRSPRCPACGRS